VGTLPGNLSGPSAESMPGPLASMVAWLLHLDVVVDLERLDQLQVRHPEILRRFPELSDHLEDATGR